MRLLFIGALATSLYGQSEFSRNVIALTPKGDNSDVGILRAYETANNGQHSIDIKGLPALPSNKTLFWPSPNVSTSLLAQNTLNFAPVIWTINRAGGTEASPSALANGDGLLSITPQIYNGSIYVDAGSMSWTALLNASIYSSRVQISTRDNTGAVATRMQIGDNNITTFNTDVAPGTTNTWSLGGNTLRWNNTFTRQLTVSTGAGEGVTADLIPNSDRVRNLGSAALPQMWANLYIGNGAVQIYSTTAQIRGSYSAGGITILNAAGGTTFSVASSSGNTVVNDLTINGTCTGCGIASPPLDLHLDSSASYVLTLGTHDTTSRQIRLQHSRGTHASPTDTVSGDLIGLISSELYGGGGYRTAAQILMHAVGTPSGTSSPGQITLCTTPSGATTCTERVAITPTGTLNIWSNLAGGFLARVQNDAADGFSGVRFFDNGSNVKASVAWGNASSGFPSTFHIGTQSADSVTLITGGTSRWTIGSTDGSLLPTTDGGPVIGNSTVKPNAVWARSFNTYTTSGLQSSAITSEAESLNWLLSTYSNTGGHRPAIVFQRANNTLGSPSTISGAQRLGGIFANGYVTGIGFDLATGIAFYAGGTISGTTVAGEIRFQTTNNSGTFADRVTIAQDGAVSMTSTLDVTGNISGSVINATGSPAYRVSGQTVIDASRNLTTAAINPITGATHDIGSGSAPYNTIAGTTLQTYTSGAVLRFQAGGTIQLRNASSVLVFEVSNTGVVSSGGSSGISTTVTVRNSAGTGTCTITFAGGIVVGTTC